MRMSPFWDISLMLQLSVDFKLLPLLRECTCGVFDRTIAGSQLIKLKELNKESSTA